MCRACKERARITALGGDPDDPLVVQQFLDQDQAWYRETIRRFGWALTYVTDPDGRHPSFTYTTGLWGFHHPELLVFGLEQDSAAGLLNQLGDRVRDGEVLAADAEVTTTAKPVRVFDVPNPGDILFVTNNVYGRPPFDSVPARQLVYPDAHGTWPWEPDCHLAPERQPMPGSFPPPGYPFV